MIKPELQAVVGDACLVLAATADDRAPKQEITEALIDPLQFLGRQLSVQQQLQVITAEAAGMEHPIEMADLGHGLLGRGGCGVKAVVLC